MKMLLSLVVLVLFSTVSMADTFTGTSGVSYTLAADGHYYPSTHVLPNGSVLPAGYTSRTVPQSFYRPVYTQPYAQGQFYSCPNGQCPNRW